MPSPGKVFQSRYRVERLLGQGGFAQVFLATDIELGREVAIKVLVPQNDGNDDRNAVRFMREAKLVARLNHPHVVMMFDYGTTEGGLLFAVFELVGGQDLSKLMTAPMPEDIVVTIIAQVLDALAAAHTAGLLHRDVKPDNVRVFPYMDEPHRVKLLDFGIARPTKDDAGLTASGMVVGTPRFMAPEVLYEEPLGPHSDIYSTGLVAYEMLTGTRSDHLQRLIHKQPVLLPPRTRVSPAVRMVVNRMLEREVPPRYSSASAARTDLLNAAREARTSRRAAAPPAEARSTPAQPPADTTAPTRPGQTPLLVGGLLALVLTLMGVGMLVGLQQDPKKAPPAAPQPDVPAPAQIKVEPLHSAPIEAIADHDAGTPLGAGCGKTSEFRGTRILSQADGLDVIEWLVHVPDDYDENRPHPLVVMLHDDSGTSAQNMVTSTKFAATADKHDFLIAAPNDDDIAYPWTEKSDLVLVTEVVSLTRDMFCVDPRRIFLLGEGGGGWGADALSCQDWVAGIATTSFLLEKPAFSCEPERPVPSLSILPMDSGFLPPDGGPDCVNNSKLSFDEFEALWGERNHCDGPRTTFAKDGPDLCQNLGCETPYVACRVHGGRRWPGTPRRAVDILGCDGPPNTFSYNETIWKFFSSL